MTAEGLFEFGETIPGVGVVGVFWGDTPEVKGGLAILFGIFDSGPEKSGGGGEVFIFRVRGGAHIVASAVVVKKEGSGDGFVVVFGEIESGERLGSFGFEILGREGEKFIVGGDSGVEFDKGV